MDRRSPFATTVQNIKRVKAGHLQMLAFHEALVPGIDVTH